MLNRIDKFVPYDSSRNVNNDSVNHSRNGNSYDSDFTSLFERSLVDYPFDEFLEIARQHSEGKIWVIGGFVYRNIIKELYGTPYEKKPIDIDFLVEIHKTKTKCPEGWVDGRTTIGDLSFSKGNEYRIDLNGLVNFHSIISRDFPEEIQSFYSGTPLDIQSISYDCEKRIVEGEVAIEAIKERVVQVNYIKEAQWEAKRISEKLGHSFSVPDLVRRKAGELDFDFKLTPGFDYEP